MKEVDLKVLELTEVMEFAIPDRSDVFPDSAIKIGYGRMCFRLESSEILHDVFTVCFKLFRTVRNSKFDGSGSSTPSCDPVSASLNRLDGFAAPKSSSNSPKVSTVLLSVTILITCLRRHIKVDGLPE